MSPGGTKYPIDNPSQGVNKHLDHCNGLQGLNFPSLSLITSPTTAWSHILLLPPTGLLSTPHSVSTNTNILKCLHLLVPLCRMLLLSGPTTSRSLFKCGLPGKSFLKLHLRLPTHPNPLLLCFIFFPLYPSLYTISYIFVYFFGLLFTPYAVNSVSSTWIGIWQFC